MQSNVLPIAARTIYPEFSETVPDDVFVLYGIPHKVYHGRLLRLQADGDWVKSTKTDKDVAKIIKESRYTIEKMNRLLSLLKDLHT